MKGLTSIEMAILLAIILVIAVAVGWYVYTTFLSTTGGTPRLNVINAIYWTNGTLELTVQNPGPVATVYIQSIYLQGQPCSLTKGNVELSSGRPVEDQQIPIAQADGVVRVIVKQEGCPPDLAVPGSSISGQVVLTSGQTFPFTAQVQLGATQSTGGSSSSG